MNASDHGSIEDGPLSVSAVVVAYNSFSSSHTNIESLQLAVGEGVLSELIVVDNSVSEREADRWAGLLNKPCKVIAPPENLGYAGAVNLAAGIAKGRWLLVINPDVFGSVDDVGEFVGKLALISPGTFSVAAQLSTGDNKVFEGIELRWGVWFADRKTSSKRSSIGPSGGFAAYDRRVFLEVGGFDETYFAWGEDAEFALRARKYGLPTCCIPSQFAHSGGHSVKTTRVARCRAYQLAMNRVRVARAYFGRMRRIAFVCVWAFTWLPRALRNCRRHTVAADLAGFIDGWLGTKRFSNRYAWPDQCGTADVDRGQQVRS